MMLKTWIVLLMVVGVFVSESKGTVALSGDVQDISVALDADGFDMALDSVRTRLYVSLPELQEVVAISTYNYQVLDRFTFSGEPLGIDLSIDGSRLFVALSDAGGIAILDLETGEIEEVDVGDQLGDPRTYDVIEGRPDRVFVSANPGSSGSAYIVMIRLDDNNSYRRVANGRTIRARPVFERSPDFRNLYVGVGFSPNSLYKLDITADDAPIILEDDHGSVSGTDRLAVSPDGLRIYLRSGQVLRTGSFIEVDRIALGVPRFPVDQDPNHVYVATNTNRVEAYRTDTYDIDGTFPLPCPSGTPDRLLAFAGGEGFLVLDDDLLCGYAVPMTPRPEPFSTLPGRAPYEDSETPVTISGEHFGFSQNASVFFGGVEATDVVVVDDATITCRAPSGEPGPVDVTITNEFGTGRLRDGYVYTPATLLTGDTDPGGTLELALLCEPQDTIAVFWSLPPEVEVEIPPFDGTFCLGSPQVLFVVPDWPLDSFVLEFVIPPDSHLGAELLMQALIGPIQFGQGTFTNCVRLTIGS